MHCKHLASLSAIAVAAAAFAAPRHAFTAPLTSDEAIAKVDKDKVDAAIKKGVAYLKSQIGRNDMKVPEHHKILVGQGMEELVAYTLHYAPVPKDDPALQQLIQVTLARPLRWNYQVSLRAMLLEAVDEEKYKSQLQTCCQWLVDTQAENGQWGYGMEIPGLVGTEGAKPAPKQVIGTGVSAGVAAGAGSATSAAPPPAAKPAGSTDVKQVVRRKHKGPPVGDNSNSQIALLALRACYEAGITASPETFERAERWWVSNEYPNGGWPYGNHGQNKGNDLSSMTEGAIGSIAIARYCRGKEYKSSESIKRGLGWLEKNFTVDHNVGDDNWHYYHLYALSRAGILYGTEEIGPHDWYPKGAEYLLGRQAADGHWEGKTDRDDSVSSTCFAILFLRRATRPIVFTAIAKP